VAVENPDPTPGLVDEVAVSIEPPPQCGQRSLVVVGYFMDVFVPKGSNGSERR
jgi:hypothetical protein